MDTNQIVQLINAAIAAAQTKAVESAVGGSSTTEIVKVILAALTPILAAIVLWLHSKTKETLSQIHTEVNHDRTVMMEELRKLRESVTDLTGRNKTLEENKRGTEMATAVREGLKAQEQPSAAAPIRFSPEQLAQIAQIITDSKPG